MTMLIKLENGIPTGFPILDDNFRQLFPSTSFPAILTEQTVEPFGYGVYDFHPRPEVQKYQKATEVTPVKNKFGVWLQTWSVVEMTNEEKTEADTNKAKEVRNERNWKLTQSDWTQLADSNVDKTAWATYRQALRDVPSQTGFPWEVTWPTKPE